MHRSTPRHIATRSNTAGGGRATVHEVNDDTLTQSVTKMKGGAGEDFGGDKGGSDEAPHPYGFSSHIFPADKDEKGNVIGSAETFVSFLGGSRSLRATGNIYDRRHRLRKLEAGDTALHRGKDDDQQFHMKKDGGYWSAPQKIRMQMVPVGSAKTEAPGAQQQQGQQAQQGQKNKPTGQKSVADAGKDSNQYVQITPSKTEVSGSHTQLQYNTKTMVDVPDENVYLGGEKAKHQFSRNLTAAGLSKNAWSRI